MRSDGALVAWGLNTNGQCDVPPLPPGLSYVEVAAGSSHTVARRSDGSVVAWGYNGGGQCSIPPPPPGLSYVQVAAGGVGTILRLSDGNVLVYGHGSHAPNPPPGISYVDVAAGSNHSLARRSDDGVVAWGDNDYGQCDVPAAAPGYAYSELKGGNVHSVASVVAREWPCGSTSRYCWPAAANSVNPAGASLGVEGCPGITANELVFTVTGLPRGVPGVLYYGSQQQQLPYGNGWGCIAGSVQRILPPQTANNTGEVIFPVDLTQFPFTGSTNEVLPGSSWNFQYWYRDPAAGGAGFNFTDAVHIVFAP